MMINITKSLPNDKAFFNLVNTFVFRCPAATVVSKKKVNPKAFENVSVRECSFRSRGITGTLLITITAQIKKTVKPGYYHRIEKGETVEAVFDADTSDEKIVFKENSQMSDAEAVYYYIRNAFAHGDIEVLPGMERVYKLESKKKNDVKAQMVLKEGTLKKLAMLSSNNKTQIEKMQKKKK